MKLFRGAISLTLLLFCLFSFENVEAWRRRRRRYHPTPACEEGEYRAQIGIYFYDCKSCNAGRYQDEAGPNAEPVSCNICGTHDAICKICPIGHYSDRDQKHCTKCQAGKTTVQQETSAIYGCSWCAEGQSSVAGEACVSESQTTMFFFCTKTHIYTTTNRNKKYLIYYIIYILLYI